MSLEEEAGGIDVDRLMDEVRRRARLARAGVDPDVPDEADRGEERRADLAAQRRGDLHLLRERFDLLATPLPARGGGRAAVDALRRQLVRLLLPVLQRQTDANGAAQRLLDSLSNHLEIHDDWAKRRDERTERRDELVDERLERLAARLVRLERQLGALSAGTAGHRTRAQAAAGSAPPGWNMTEFQRRFRGSEDEIRRRQRQYVPCFSDGGPVLDLGCGRGEFLDLLREAGIEASGVDADEDSALHCRAKGHRVVQADAAAYLDSVPTGSLGGVFCAQLIEHLLPRDAATLLGAVAAALRPGGVAVIETPNPQCLAIFAHAFFLDPTHVWPYHPEMLRYLMEEAGLAEIRIVPSGPLDAAAWMPEMDGPAPFGDATDAYNRAARLVNMLLLGPQDYAAVGIRAQRGV